MPALAQRGRKLSRAQVHALPLGTFVKGIHRAQGDEMHGRISRRHHGQTYVRIQNDDGWWDEWHYLAADYDLRLA